MATGYGSNGSCFASVTDAVNDHYGSALIDSYDFLASGHGTTQFNYVAGAWQRETTQCYYNSTTPYNCVLRVDAARPYTPYPCTLQPSDDPVQQFTDGAILGWGIAAAMVAAWAVTVLRRGIH